MTFDLPLTEQNLILTGYIGPDQPRLGRQIAEQLRMPFVDVEVEIANRADRSIEDIRAYYGETHLKTMEADIVRETALRRSTVIRISGRTLQHADHLPRLQTTGPVICLVIELGAMLRRLHVNMGARYHDPQERAVAFAELKREWAVRGMPGIHEMDTTPLTHEEIIQNVRSLWQDLAIRRG